MFYVYLLVALVIVYWVLKPKSNPDSSGSTACGDFIKPDQETALEMDRDGYQEPELSLPYEDDFMYDDKGVHDSGRG